MERLTDKLNELNANGKLEYNDYSLLFDLASELETKCDKLEAGIPFEPVCKVGDTVYQLLKSLTTPDMYIDPLTIVSAKFYEDAILYIAKDRYQLTSYVESTKLNKNWFLTYEEAEKRLEELRGC